MDKSNMISENKTISVTMLEVTTNLAENLAQSEPFLRFRAAEQRLHADQEAMQLLADVSAAQQNLRRNQSPGPVSESDIQQLRALQSAIGLNESIQDYLLTQELAVAFLREVNQEISSLIGVDFASLTRKSGGCC